MPPQSRFGASKYRNAVPHFPPREEWYRPAHSAAGSGSGTTTSALSTFSNELKTTREYIVTLNQSGELSIRGYGADDSLTSARVGSGGGVGDWDLSGLEGGQLVVGGMDGAISVYTLPPPSDPSPPTLEHTIPPSSSPITNLSFHPTTRNILLASTINFPLRIYDLSSPSSSSSPIIELNISEPKGLWSAAWSTDGRLLAALGKSGTLYLYDPRSGPDPLTFKSLSFSVQALKPAKIAWVGDDIFLTSFSKTRNRQYSLLCSSSLSTVFTQSLDTSPNVLLPLVDEERRIVYTASKGDMTLRQIELSGPAGYQETLHPLTYPLASQGLALAHPSRLDVMQAEIARVLVPAVDKDGDALVPLGVRVPRRQLIDYHDDLFPDMRSTVPEQSAEEWLKGGDKVPLSISLDPSRRGAWEAELATKAGHRSAGPSASSHSQSASIPSTVLEAAENKSSDSSKVQQASLATSSTPAPPQPTPTSTTSATTSNPPTSDVAASQAPTTQPDPAHESLPPLEDGESYSSTTYKVRIIADHIAEQYRHHKASGAKSPLFVGLQGPQGCGKTTLCTTLLERLKEVGGITAAVLSLDDLYKTHDGLEDLARQHPDNALLAGRGPPGTHDTKLAKTLLDKVKAINGSAGQTVDLPIFDKSLCGGEGDRSTDTVKVEGPLDVFVLEGWSMGFGPLSDTSLAGKYDALRQSSSKTYSSAHPLSSMRTLNIYLGEVASEIYPYFSTLVQIEPTTYEYVFSWRLEQEHAMKAANGGRGMTDEQVTKFVERYMPGYELWSEEIWARGTPWEGKGLRLRYGEKREVLEVVKPSGNTVSPNVGATAAPVAGQGAGGDGVKVTGTGRSAAPPTTNVTATQPPPAATSSSAPAPTAPTVSRSVATASTSPKAPHEPFNPNWSRKFLAAKSPLIPTYDSLPPLSTLHPDSKLLKATPHLAFFPVQGTGGRLGVHPLKKKGRMEVGGEGYLASGVEIVDFDVEPFTAGDGRARVAVAGEDGVIRVWKVSPDGVHGVGPEAEQTLKGKGIDKITQIAFHSTAQDLLVAVTNDHGSAHLRFWDLSSGEESKAVKLPTIGAFNMSFSPAGDRVAIATKDGQIFVLDPRKSDSPLTGKAHDSPRSFQMAWLDDQHLSSVGFSRGSQRKINLYRLPSSSTPSSTPTSAAIVTIFSLTVDVSPSVLFPQYDPDTSILYIWGKGERVIQAYEVHPQQKEAIAKLPSYTSGSPQVGVVWVPKTSVDVSKVEVGKALRLTGKTLEEVTFSIPRNKPDFFQDDIYVPTLDISTPVSTAREWLDGKDGEQGRISLQPEGMTPLSQAPKTSTTKTKFVPATEVMSEEAKRKKEMDELFAKAKMDESSDEEMPVKGLAPPDDDW